MSRPLISVVVPVYNGARDLPACLDSIARGVEMVPPALRDAVEVVVCDNHSTDATPEIIAAAEFGCESRVVQPPGFRENRTENWRHGLAEARGEWMMMLHADDMLAPGGLAALLETIKEPAAERAVLVALRHRTFSDPEDPSELRPRWPFPGLLNGPLLARTVLPLHCALTPFTLMRRDAYESVGGLDTRWQLVQDWDLWLRLAQIGDVLYAPDEVAWWRIHPTSAAYQEQNATETLQLSRHVADILPAASRTVTSLARRAGRARAAVQREGIEAHAAVDTTAPTRRLQRVRLAVALTLYALRGAGTVRLHAPTALRRPYRPQPVARSG